MYTILIHFFTDLNYCDGPQAAMPDSSSSISHDDIHAEKDCEDYVCCRIFLYEHCPAEGYGIKYEGNFLEKSQSGCVQNCCHFVCLHHFWA